MALLPSVPQSEEEKRAQRDAKQQDAMLREVDEAYRQDQLARFARNYGKQLVAALVVGLALFGGILWWQAHREGAKEEKSEELVKALDQFDAGNFDTAGQALAKLEKDGDSGMATAAKMARAGTALRLGRQAEASRIYGEVSADSSAPGPYRDLATIRQVSLDYEKLKPADVIAKMKPLATPGAPFFGSAGEILGAAYLDNGETKLAGQLFGEIAKDKNVPDSLRSRARQLAGLLGVDAIVDVDQTLKDLRRDDKGPQ